MYTSVQMLNMYASNAILQIQYDENKAKDVLKL